MITVEHQDGTRIELPKEAVPADTRIGDTVRYKNSDIVYRIDWTFDPYKVFEAPYYKQGTVVNIA